MNKIKATRIRYQDYSSSPMLYYDLIENSITTIIIGNHEVPMTWELIDKLFEENKKPSLYKFK